MPNKKILINYTNRDFNSIKTALEEHARRYYPNTYRDFSENSFGSYVLDAVSYVGDMLSFNLDYQVNESFLETALEYENVRKLARNYGYKFTGRPAAFGTVSLYILVPANSTSLGPDRKYLPVLRAGSEFKSVSGTSFVLIDDVDFNNPNNQVVAARFSQATSKPTSYAVRALGNVKSTVLYRTVETVGAFNRFSRVRVGDSSISEIKSVVDTEGHEYYEVDHLSQDVVYVETTNPNVRNDGVISIMKPKVVPRRFVVIQDDSGTYLQFGYGTDEEIVTTDVTDPSQIALKMTGKPYITDSAFDPTKLLDSQTLGVVPSNTSLTILYYANDNDSVNIASNGITIVSSQLMTFPNASNNSLTLEDQVRSSLEVSNQKPIVGNTSLPTAEEIRYRSYATYAAQNRAVTRNDYEAYLYMMPPKFGSIKRATIVNDPSSTNRRISLYLISEDSSGLLTQSSAVLKENIKVWLNKNKMLNDNIDIYDAKILNIGFEYNIIVNPTKDKITVLNEVNRRLKREMAEKMYIGEPFYITNIYNIANKVDGVVDTTKVNVYLKTGARYSTAPVSIAQLKSKDGTYLKAPKNVIFEIKYFDNDVRGTAI